MPVKRADWAAGQLLELEHSSRVLADNPLKDPHVRKLHVWLPPGYSGTVAKGRGKRYPVLFDLVGFTGSGLAHTHWKSFAESIPEQAARLMHERKMGPTVLVFPDCFTALGGNQYINSSAIGAYSDYLLKELIPLVDREFRTLASRDHRGCFGKSSGGYGAMIHGMKHPEHWGAIANHSGDAYFDFVYKRDWPATLDMLGQYAQPARRAGRIDVASKARRTGTGVDDGRIKRFLESFWAKRKVSDAEVHAIMILCMAASYDPDPRAPLGFRLPFDLETGAIIDKRWQRWLRHDPIVIAREHRAALKSLRGIWIDCGWSDQYFIHYGARQLSLVLQGLGVNHVYEEFADTHSSIDYRLDASLPFLYKALKG